MQRLIYRIQRETPQSLAAICIFPTRKRATMGSFLLRKREGQEMLWRETWLEKQRRGDWNNFLREGALRLCAAQQSTMLQQK